MTVKLTLQPWDEYARPFTIEVNGETVHSEVMSSGEWFLQGEVTVKWAGFFHPSGEHVTDDVYTFNTQACKEVGQILDIDYHKVDESKPDSIVVECMSVETTETGTTTTVPTVESTTTVVPDSTVNPGSGGNVAGVGGNAGPVVPQVLSVSTDEQLPFTGGHETVSAYLGLVVFLVGMATWLKSRQLRKGLRHG